MSYGISLVNDFGVEIIDTENPVLMLSYEGVTVGASASPAPGSPIWYAALPFAYDVVSPFNSGVATPSGYEWVQNAGKWFWVPAGVPATARVSDTTFYQLSNHTIETSLQVVFDLGAAVPAMPTACIGHINTIGVPFRVAGVMADGHVPSGYGMAIWDASGRCIFDADNEFMSVRYSCIVPKSKIDDILENGTVVDIVLPEAMPNAWIALPIHAHIRQTEEQSGSSYRYTIHKVVVTQINSTTVRMSRKTYDPSSFAATRRPVYSYTHDTILYFARDV